MTKRTEYNSVLLRDRMKALVKKYGGVRPTARVLRVDPGYVSRICSGTRLEPSDVILRRLGLIRLITYVHDGMLAATPTPSDSKPGEGT